MIAMKLTAEEWKWVSFFLFISLLLSVTLSIKDYVSVKEWNIGGIVFFLVIIAFVGIIIFLSRLEDKMLESQCKHEMSPWSKIMNEDIVLVRAFDGDRIPSSRTYQTRECNKCNIVEKRFVR